jgi:integrase
MNADRGSDRRVKAERVNDHEFVFPGGRPRKPLSNMAMLKVLERMGRGDLTAHGFRSSFRDWAAERTGFPQEIAEMALAHTVCQKLFCYWACQFCCWACMFCTFSC